MEFTLDGSNLTIDRVCQISRAKQVKLNISEAAKKNIEKSFQYVQKVVEEGTSVVYGINTGFGALSNKHIDKKDLGKLQLNLIRSHCTGVGDPFPREVVRAILLLRANCLMQGNSGVSFETLRLILDFIEEDIIPVIPEQGSVGASGDLAPLSHMTLALIGEGEVFYDGKKLSSDFVMHSLGKKPLVLKPKEGLALINGTTVMAALGALATNEALRLAKLCDIASAMTLDSLQGSIKPFDPDISRIKPHKGD